MFDPIEIVGYRSMQFVEHLGRMATFAGEVCVSVVKPPFRFQAYMKELHKSGVLSLIIICLSGLAVGMVLGLQGYHTLIQYGLEQSLGALVGASLIRELGPVLAALLVVGRAGSAMTAGLGEMVATEQLDGLRMLSIDPIHMVIKPRALAMLTVMPLLTALFIVFGIGGGYLAGVTLLGGAPWAYMSSMRSAVDLPNDIVGSVVKSLAFGFLVSIIATYGGYHCEPTSEGVSKATTWTVVTGAVSVLLFDYAITALWGV